MTPEQLHALKYKREVTINDAQGRPHVVRVHTIEAQPKRGQARDKQWFLSLDGRKLVNHFFHGQSHQLQYALNDARAIGVCLDCGHVDKCHQYGLCRSCCDRHTELREAYLRGHRAAARVEHYWRMILLIRHAAQSDVDALRQLLACATPRFMVGGEP